MCLNFKKKKLRIQMIIFIILFAITLPLPVYASESQQIMGETITNKEAMVEYYKSHSPTPYPSLYLEQDVDLDKFLDIIIQEADIEGVRADIVFLQILLETDYLAFNSEVDILQNNFGGLKDKDGNYLSFDSIEEGIRANVQLLKGYASLEPLNKEKITTLYDLINPKGLITYIEDLGNGNWSEDPEYGDNINRCLEEMINTEISLTPVSEEDISLIVQHSNEIEKQVDTDLENIQESQEKNNSEIETIEIHEVDKQYQEDEKIPVEIKTLTLDGTGFVGSGHRIRSYGTSTNGVLYQFWVKDLRENKWTMIQDYSKSSAAWTPTKPGNYLYGVHIKDEKSNERLDTHLYNEVTIKQAEVKTLTIDGSSYVGGSHRIRSYGTSTNGVLYQFWVKDLSNNKWTMIQDYSKSSASWTPIKPGNYLYGVHVKDEKSNERLDTYLYQEVTIRPAEIKTLTIDGSGNVGGSYRIRSYGESANGTLYQFWIKDLSTNKWTMIQDYSKSSAPWTPTKPGNYLYGVHIKDEKSNARLDAHLYKNITITNKTIMLDPGHGGTDSGAYYGGTAERDLNLIVANKVASQLRNQGYNVVMSRTTNNSPNNNDIYDRAARANAAGADIYVSIHHNAMPNSSSVSGIESYYYIPKSAYPPLPGNAASHNDPKRLSNSLKLANSIQNELIKATGANNRGVKRRSYVVVRETQMPAVLLELGYMTNKAELKRLKSDSYQNTLANAIVQGINDYYGK